MKPFPISDQKIAMRNKGLVWQCFENSSSKTVFNCFQKQNSNRELKYEKLFPGLILHKSIVHLCTMQKFPKYYSFFQCFFEHILKKKKKKPAFGTIFQKTVFYSKFVKPCFLS